MFDELKNDMMNCTIEQLQELINYADELIQYKEEKEVVEFEDFWSDLLEIIGNAGHTNMLDAVSEWYDTNPDFTVELTEYHYHVLAKNAVLWADEYEECLKEGKGFCDCEPFYATEEERMLANNYEE